MSVETSCGLVYGLVPLHAFPSGVQAVDEVRLFQCSANGADHWQPPANFVTSTS